MTPAAQFLPGLYVCVCSMSQLINVIRRLNIVEEMTNNRLRSVELKKTTQMGQLNECRKEVVSAAWQGTGWIAIAKLVQLAKVGFLTRSCKQPQESQQHEPDLTSFQNSDGRWCRMTGFTVIILVIAPSTALLSVLRHLPRLLGTVPLLRSFNPLVRRPFSPSSLPDRRRCGFER